MAMRLKATKTSLYKLVSEYSPLPTMKQTEFYKAPRHADYFLNWYIDGLYYHAFFAACAGKPLLSIQVKEDQREIERKVHTVTIQDLQDRGMIDNRKD